MTPTLTAASVAPEKMELHDATAKQSLAFHNAFLGLKVARTDMYRNASYHAPRFQMSSSSESASLSYPRRVSRAVVWFRDGDLRVEDHPGLDAACSHTSDALAPLLICTPRTKKASLEAVRRLKKELQDRGSHLVLRYSDDEATGVIEFLTEFRAERVHVRMDVEHEARDVVSRVEQAMDGITSVHTWSTELRDWDDEATEVLASLPDEYPKFLRWPVRANTDVVSSNAAYQPAVILPGPGVDDRYIPFNEILERHRRDSPSTAGRHELARRFEEDQKIVRAITFDASTESFGETSLKEFLRRSDAYQEPDTARSLSEVFRQGALSPWRMYEIVHDHERRNGRIFRWLYREGAKMVLDWLDAREFATLMARRDVHTRATVDGEHEAKFWRWNGFLVRYVEEGRGADGADKKPPLLLIHGFGASSQHFRRSLPLLKKRYRVFAVDLLGFGRSEKPPTQYTQVLWESMVWDFVTDVIQEPVFIAGNSIGGYIACAFGVDSHPDLCCGICLINSAGKLLDVTNPQPVVPKKDGLFQYTMKQSRAARILAGNVLLKSLQGRIDKTLKMVYPANPEAADEQLAKEIRRNSLDYGAAEVLSSGFILPPPRPLSMLLQKYTGPLLLFQGELDPLNNAKQRADTIQQQYPTATVVRVQAGHCPHEEDAERFVEAVSSWMDSVLTTSSREPVGSSTQQPVL